jgi:DeoR family transcriptional regulator, fructose operon transcriptional repressor
MRSEKTYPEERLSKILKILENEDVADVDQLSALFGVSGATIRSDLRELDDRGLVIRTHGGVMLRDPANQNLKIDSDPAYTVRKLQNSDAKEAIGKAVAELIDDGDCIMLDDGSTTLCVAKTLPLMKKDITVITNGLNICLELSLHKNINVIATGGTLNKSDLSYQGKIAQEVASKYNANKAVLGASGISAENGFMTTDESKAELKKAMIESSRELIVVADHTKLSRISPITVCNLKKVNVLVTDAQADKDTVNMMRECGIKVIIA